jgi:hypothetical protein
MLALILAGMRLTGVMLLPLHVWGRIRHREQASVYQAAGGGVETVALAVFNCGPAVSRSLQPTRSLSLSL